MSDSLINTKRRITTIKSTEKITKAMKLVASVKFQRWKKYYDDNTAYIDGLEEVLKASIQGSSKSSYSKLPYVIGNESENALYIVVSSSLGLCGAYNYNLFKETDNLIHDGDGIIPIGVKAQSHYRKKNSFVTEDYVNIMDSFSYSKVRRLRHEIIREYKTGKYGKVCVIYTDYKNSMTFIPKVEKIIPFDTKRYEDDSNVSYEPLFEPDSAKLMMQLIPHYIDAYLYRLLLKSEISELASRRNAMEAATDAADKIVNQLTIEYNKSRQNAITQEITEVVAGATAGRKKE